MDGGSEFISDIQSQTHGGAEFFAAAEAD